MNALERHALRILGLIAETDREAVAVDPKRALTERFGLRVREQDELAQRRDAGGWCDGISFLDDGVVLRHGKFTLPVTESNKPPAVLTVDQIQTELRFETNDVWSLDNFQANFADAKFVLAGELRNAQSITNWPIFHHKDPFYRSPYLGNRGHLPIWKNIGVNPSTGNDTGTICSNGMEQK